MNLVNIKSMHLNISLLLFVIATSLFISEDAQAQTDPNLSSLSFHFDTTQLNSPLYIHGELANVSEIKGVSIILSRNTTASSVLNDTLIFVGSYGSFYTLWNGEVSPMQGNTFIKAIPVNANSGMYYCTSRILYKNGTASNSNISYLKK